MRRYPLGGNAKLVQCAAHHDTHRHLCQGHAGGLAYKRDGARGTRIDLEDVDHPVADRELDVHQTDHMEFQGEEFRLAPDLRDNLGRERVGGQ